MKNLLTLLGFLKPFLKEVMLSILLGIATIGAGIGLLGTSAYLIASAALHPSIAELQVAIVGVRFFGLSRAGFRYLERLVSHSVNLHILAQIRSWYYTRVASGPPNVMLQQRSGDLLQRVMGDLEILENFYVRVVSPLVVVSVVTVGASFFLGFFSAELGLILAVGLVLNGLFLPYLTTWISRKTAKAWIENRGDVSVQTIEFLEGLEDLQANGADQEWMRRIHEKNRLVGGLQIRNNALGGVGSGISLLVLNLTVMALLYVCIPLVGDSTVSGVSLAVILLVAMASFEATAGMPQAANLLAQSLEAANRIFGVDQVEFSPAVIGKVVETGGGISNIVLTDVDFAYPGESSFALIGLNLTLQRGKKVGVVGPSGSGKTSLVNLINRFWTPDSGRIHYDSVQSASVPCQNGRALIAEITQATYLFSASVRENLLLADPEASDEEMVKALKTAELDDWFKDLPAGLNTWVGDHGLKLSGGERQRLAIARAILQDRPFLILDEPVENLDVITARKLLSTLLTVFSDRGILLISHDIKSMRAMDEILVMGAGVVVERGTHAELMAMDGRYSELVRLDENRLD